MPKTTSSPHFISNTKYSHTYRHVVLTGRKLRNLVFPATFTWRRGLNSELDFWHTFLVTKGSGYEGFERRLNPDGMLQDATVISRLNLLPPQDKPLRILDTSYRAANWISLGEMSGRGRMDQHHEARGSAVKRIYIYPLRCDVQRRLRQGLQPRWIPWEDA